MTSSLDLNYTHTRMAVFEFVFGICFFRGILQRVVARIENYHVWETRSQAG